MAENKIIMEQAMPLALHNSINSISSTPSARSLKQIAASNAAKWQQMPPGAQRLIVDNDRFVTEHYSPFEVISANGQPGPVLKQSDRNGGSFKLELADQDGDELYVYRTFFYGREHKNLIGYHPDLGPICVSLRKETDSSRKAGSVGNKIPLLYRGVLRTSERFTYATRPDTELTVSKSTRYFGNGKLSTRDVLVGLFPQCENAKLKEIDDQKLQVDLLAMEEKMIETNYKFGVLYCKAGQANEDEMFSNEHGSAQFDKFLECIGERVKLKGFKGFRGGLDVKEDKTGHESVWAKYRDSMDIMFHVSTLLPYSSSNKQQISRKAHIGNDIGVIVFKEPGVVFDPQCIVSQFPHYFLVVEPVNNDPNNTYYRVAVTRRDDVPSFGPTPAVDRVFFHADAIFREFVHAKMINGENASYSGNKFTQLRQRTRKTFLEELTKTHLRNAALGSNSSLSQLKSQLFGTQDNLNRAAGLEKRGADLIRRQSLSALPARSNTFEPEMTRNEPRVSSPVAPQLEMLDTSFSSPPTSPVAEISGDLNRSSAAAMRDLEREKMIESQRASRLKTENADLKLKLEKYANKEVDRLLFEQSELKLKVELAETRVKLSKALAYIETLTGEGQGLLTELKPQPQPNNSK